MIGLDQRAHVYLQLSTAVVQMSGGQGQKKTQVVPYHLTQHGNALV